MRTISWTLFCETISQSTIVPQPCNSWCAIWWQLELCVQSIYEIWMGEFCNLSMRGESERGEEIIFPILPPASAADQWCEMDCRFSAIHFEFCILQFAVLPILAAAADQWCEVECRFSADSVHHRLQWKCNVSGLVKCNCNAQCISEETNAMQYSTLQWSCHLQCNEIKCIGLATRNAIQDRGTQKGSRGIHVHILQDTVQYRDLERYSAVQQSRIQWCCEPPA